MGISDSTKSNLSQEFHMSEILLTYKILDLESWGLNFSVSCGHDNIIPTKFWFTMMVDVVNASQY